jgi:hypothetical protein
MAIIANEQYLTKLLATFCKQVGAGTGSFLFKEFQKCRDWSENIDLVNSYDDYFRKTVIPHKVAVYRSGMEMVSKSPIAGIIPPSVLQARLLVHDLSKFTVIESNWYAAYNFRDKGANSEEVQRGFDAAWWHHKVCNDHHPEFWISVGSDLSVIGCAAMSTVAVFEMIADWVGAGKTYGSSLENWLPKNIGRFAFHPDTAKLLIELLGKLGFVCSLQSELPEMKAAKATWPINVDLLSFRSEI